MPVREAEFERAMAHWGSIFGSCVCRFGLPRGIRTTPVSSPAHLERPGERGICLPSLIWNICWAKKLEIYMQGRRCGEYAVRRVYGLYFDTKIPSSRTQSIIGPQSSTSCIDRLQSSIQIIHHYLNCIFGTEALIYLTKTPPVPVKASDAAKTCDIMFPFWYQRLSNASRKTIAKRISYMKHRMNIEACGQG